MVECVHHARSPQFSVARAGHQSSTVTGGRVFHRHDAVAVEQRVHGAAIDDARHRGLAHRASSL